MKEVVLEAGGLLRGNSGPALESFLLRDPAVRRAEASQISETVAVAYDGDPGGRSPRPDRGVRPPPRGQGAAAPRLRAGGGRGGDGAPPAGARRGRAPAETRRMAPDAILDGSSPTGR